MMLSSRLVGLGAWTLLQLVSPLALAQTDTDTPAQMTDHKKDAASLEGQLLVKFSNTLTDAEMDEINARLGATVINRMSGGRLLLVEIRYPSVRQQILDAYTATEGVIYAEPNQAVSIPPSPDQDRDGAPKGEDRSSSPTIGIPRIGE